MNARVALIAALLSAVAGAQTPVPGFELERLQLNPGAVHGLWLQSADLLPELRYRVGLTFHFERAPLVVVSGGQRVSELVAARWTMHLSGAFSPTDWLEVGAQLPLVLAQPGDAAPPLGLAPVASGFAVGTGYLHARGALFAQRRGSPLDFSLGVAVGFPLGTPESLTSEAAVIAVPTLAAGRTLNTFLRAGASVSFMARPARALSANDSSSIGSEIGSYLCVGAGLSTLGTGLRGELFGRLDAPFTRSGVAGEVLVGARYPLGTHLEVYALGGPGFGAQPGTPAFRVLLGLAFAPPAPAPASPEAPRCAPGAAHKVSECPLLDFDGDGVANEADACPEELGLARLKGCPELDADGDGLLDGDDACPADAGFVALQGCRPPDADGDGVPDERDACPAIAAPRSLRGCLDADGDGLDSLDDVCPEVSGVAELKGCPDTDTDGDGVVDRLDACVNGTGGRANQGCPEKERLLVVITRDRLIIKDQVYFATGRSVVLPQSFRLLLQIARIVKEHPEVERVSIEGHTDDRGNKERNRRLSEARAEAVRQFLQKAGVPPARMVSRGFGPDRPMDTNQTAAGRETNRRVDFVIVGAEQ